MNVETRLDELERDVRPFELFVHVFAQALGDPLFYHSGQSHSGFRYAKPDIRHFCLLKLVRTISALHAMVCLARRGFTQEIAVLIRTIAECTTLIEFALVNRNPDGSLAADATELVESYFADFARNDITDYKKSKLKQGQVHATIGAKLDSFLASNEGGEPPSVPAERLYSRTYLAFSGYVHCKYPETMDLCGGAGPHFHLRGMLGTPKDAENVAHLETYIETVNLSVRSVIVHLGLWDVVQSNAELLEWHRRTSGVPWPNS